MRWLPALCLCWMVLSVSARADESYPGTGRIDFFGYTDCVVLKNERTRVILCHQAGGRILEYSLDGKNALVLKPGTEGTLTDMSAGRFDIGPEYLVPRRPKLWTGEWTVTLTGPRQARLTSQIDEAVGVRLIRDITLDEQTSRLRVVQTVENVSSEPKYWCHWSRTFAPTGGVVVVPLSQPSRLPRQFIMYEEKGYVNFLPSDPHIVLRDNLLQIVAPPRRPKSGFDSTAGWLAYLEPNGLLFLKQFAVNPNAVYDDVMGISAAVYYPDSYFVELEPVGPRMNLPPGGSDSFTEIWSLAEFSFPGSGNTVDSRALLDAVEPLLIPAPQP
ncbi:hypothetical protein [Planctomicrobium sp. SH664]|uniref:hypothetical protein n=1 Tax=Planctomicrobium sp. SH664 TaxID=3448125 RepID=UPI003F5C0412